MVNLTMRAGETLVIGQNLAFTVVAIEGNRVRIDIAARGKTAIHVEGDFRRRQRTISSDNPDIPDRGAESTRIP